MSETKAADILQRAHGLRLTLGSTFDDESAFACSLYSALTYHTIQEFELGRRGNVQLVPSSIFRLKIRRPAETRRQWEAAVDLSRELWPREVDDSNPIEIFSTAYLVIAVLRTPSVIIVAIRGTTDLYDLFVRDFSPTWKTFGPSGQHERFHGGFYATAAEAGAAVANELRSKKWYADLPIVLTGHSLGGAAAGVLLAHPKLMGAQGRVLKGYVFGTPQYASKRVFTPPRTPYHVRFQSPVDWVPDLSPPWMRLAQVPGTRAIAIVRSNPFGFCRHAIEDGGLRMSFGPGMVVPGHDIEHYYSALECLQQPGHHRDVSW